MILSFRSSAVWQALLLLTVGVYAVASNPTPDEPGLPEIFIGGGLFVLAVVSLRRVLTLNTRLGSLYLTLMFFMLVLLIQCVVVGVLHGSSLVNIIRDLIPYLFYISGFLLYPLYVGSKNSVAIAFLSLLVISILFTIRHFFDAGLSINMIGSGFYNNSMLYLSTDSSIIFAALSCLFISLNKLIQGRISNSLVLGLVALFPFALLAIRGHRSPFMLAAIFLILAVFMPRFLTGRAVDKNISHKNIVVLFVVFMLSFVFIQFDVFNQVIDRIFEKTREVGANGRFEEFSAVIDVMFGSTSDFLFGLGFGSTFLNPVIGSEVGFTHNSFSYYFLKGGLIGICVNLFFLIFLVKKLIIVWKANAVYIPAFLSTFATAFMINPGFRTIGFGVCCLLLMLLSSEVQRERNDFGRRVA